jgi:hypothetical protein
VDLARSHPVPRIEWEALVLLRHIAKVLVPSENDFHAAIEIVASKTDVRLIVAGLRLLTVMFSRVGHRVVGLGFDDISALLRWSFSLPVMDTDDAIAVQWEALRKFVHFMDQNRGPQIEDLLCSFVVPFLAGVPASVGDRIEQRAIPCLFVLEELVGILPDQAFVDMLEPFVGLMFVLLEWKNGLVVPEVFELLQLLSQKLHQQMRPFVPRMIELVLRGLASQSPQIMSAAGLLYADVFKNVDDSELGQPFAVIYDLFQYAGDPEFQMVLPALLRAVIHVLEHLFECHREGEVAQDRVDLIVELLEQQAMVPVDIDVLEDLEAAEERCRACLHGYRLFFENTLRSHPTRQDRLPHLAMATQILRGIVSRVKAFHLSSAVLVCELCKFMATLGNAFGSKIASALNHRDVKRLLMNGSKIPRIHDQCYQAMRLAETVR